MAAGTSAGMAAVAASQAAIATQMANEAEMSRCKIVVSNFNSHAATIAESKDFANCIYTLYPDPISGSTVVVWKALFVLALIGMACGAFVAHRDEDDFYGYMANTVVGFFALPLLVCAACGFVYGLYWLFT